MPRSIVLAAVVLGFAALPVAAQECVWIEPLKDVTLRVERVRSLDLDVGAAPGGLAANAAGFLYSAHPDGGYVDVRDRAGDLVSNKPGLARPYAVALDPSGRVYVGEQLPGRVSVFDADWNLEHYLGQGAGEFINPTGIAVDPAGAGWIYVTDGGTHEVRVYGGDGSFLFAFGGHGSDPGLFDFPSAIHLAPGQGGSPTRLFVSDQNNDRIQILDEDGDFVSCIGGNGGTQRFGRVTGLGRDWFGRLFVADSFQGKVWVFDPDGALLMTVGEFGATRGHLMTPLGLAVSDNRLYVASFNTGRVEVFGFQGSGPRPTASLKKGKKR